MFVWFGMENGILIVDMLFEDLVFVCGDNLLWYVWGNYYEIQGEGGEVLDYLVVVCLLEFYKVWLIFKMLDECMVIWEEMLQIYVDEMFCIGLVLGVCQLVVIKGVENVLQEGIYGWDLGVYFGIYCMDEFYLV